MTTKRCPQASIQPIPQEHMESQPHQHFAIIWTLPVACTKLQPECSTRMQPQKQWFQKEPKSAETQGRGAWTCPYWGGGLLGRNVALGPSPKFVVVSIPFCFNSMNADKRLWVRHRNAISALAHGP